MAGSKERNNQPEGGNWSAEVRSGEDRLDRNLSREPGEVVEVSFKRTRRELADMVAGIAYTPGLTEIPVNQAGRFVMKAADDSTLIVDFDNMTFVRRPNRTSPRRKLPFELAEVSPIRVEDNPTFVLGHTRYTAATILSIHRFDETLFVGKQRELHQIMAQGLDPTSRVGSPSLRIEWARHVMLGSENVDDALGQIVAGLQQWATNWHAEERSARDASYERARVDYTDLSTDTQLIIWLREHLDQNGSIW